jgi:hypothetical protein
MTKGRVALPLTVVAGNQKRGFSLPSVGQRPIPLSGRDDKPRRNVLTSVAVRSGLRMEYIIEARSGEPKGIKSAKKNMYGRSG